MATVLWFSPHQDDETLTMGAGIRNHLEVGHEVHVILATDGISSGARPGTGLSRTRFARARDDEFHRACRLLGVPRPNVHLSRFQTEDGALTVERARDVIAEYVERFPGSWVKTHTDRATPGRSADHARLGAAAVQLHREGVVDNLRLYIEPYEVADFRAAYPGTSITTEDSAAPEAVRAAVDEYRRVDHAGGMYGIGNLSVRSYLDAVYANPLSYYHLP